MVTRDRRIAANEMLIRASEQTWQVPVWQVIPSEHDDG
jgi:hypothetical protein